MVLTINTATQAAGICPDCGSLRTPGARYCEACRYDHEQGQATVDATPLASAGGADATVVSTPAATGKLPLPRTRHGYLVVTVDAQQAGEYDALAECPVDRPAQTFPLKHAETRIGRRSANRGLYPEVELDDVGVSHQHLMLLQHSDGSFAVLELGSANGTRLNGRNLRQGVAVTIKTGDELRLGAWTRITLEEK